MRGLDAETMQALEGVSPETLRALKEVPVDVVEALSPKLLHALAAVPPDVLLALREVSPSMLQAAPFERRAAPAGVLDSREATPTAGAPGGSVSSRAAPAEGENEPSSGGDELHRLWQRTMQQLERALTALSAAGNNVVGHVGAFSGEPWWSIRCGRSADRLITNPDYKVAHLLSVLGSEVRLAILRSLLQAPRGAGELVAELQMGTTGQAYYHLRELERAGFVEQREGRYQFAIGMRRIYLAALGLAADSGAEAPDDEGD